MSRRPVQHAVFALFLLPPEPLRLLEIQIEGAPAGRRTCLLPRRQPLDPASVGKPADLLSPIRPSLPVRLRPCPVRARASPWRSAAEFRVLGFVVLFWVLEGLLWFVATRLTACAGSTRNPSTGAVTPVGAPSRRSPTDLFTGDKMPKRRRCSPNTETSFILIYSSYEAYPLRTTCFSHEFEQVSQIISRQPTVPSI